MRIVAAVALLVALAGGAWFWTHRDDGPPGSEPIAARPAPAVPVAPVLASGPCGDALDSVRAITVGAESGSLLDEPTNQALQAALHAIWPVCDQSTAASFMELEVLPWLTYLPSNPVPDAPTIESSG